MNLNQLAKQITLREGLKKQTNIAQVKEVLRVLVDMEYEAIVVGLLGTSKDYAKASPLCPLVAKAVKQHKKKKTKKAKRK